MSDLKNTIKAHFIHRGEGMVAQQLIQFAPSVGDELRFSGDRFYRVVGKVWVYDEPEAHFSRINIEVEQA